MNAPVLSAGGSTATSKSAIPISVFASLADSSYSDVEYPRDAALASSRAKLASSVTELSAGVAETDKAISGLVSWVDQVVRQPLPTAIRSKLAVLASELTRSVQRVTDAATATVDTCRYFEQPWAVRDVEVAALRAELDRRAATEAATQRAYAVALAQRGSAASLRAQAAWVRLTRGLQDRRRRTVAAAALRHRIAALRDQMQAMRRRPAYGPPHLPNSEPDLLSAAPPPAVGPHLPQRAPSRPPLEPSRSSSIDTSATTPRTHSTQPPARSVSAISGGSGSERSGTLGLGGGGAGIPPLYPVDMLPSQRTVFAREEVAELRALHSRQMQFIAENGSVDRSPRATPSTLGSFSPRVSPALGLATTASAAAVARRKESERKRAEQSSALAREQEAALSALHRTVPSPMSSFSATYGFLPQPPPPPSSPGTLQSSATLDKLSVTSTPRRRALF